jgi:hypothetical protein
MDVFVWRVWVVDDGDSAGDGGAGNQAIDPLRQTDVSGFGVEARDGHIGKVDEATYETGASYLVVDTGFWIFGKKRMIPAGLVERVDPDERKVYLSVTKDEVKNAPDYDPDRFRDADYQSEVADHYQRVAH